MTQEPARKPHPIVVGLDFSDLSQRALGAALEQSRGNAHAELHVLVVAEPQGILVRLPGATEAESEEAARESARARVATLVETHVKSHPGPLGIDRIAVYVAAGEPASLLTDLAEAVDAELVVVGTHGRRGLRRFFLGSVASKVVRDAPCGVLVVRPGDFLEGEPVPSIEPPLPPGAPHLRNFEHRRTYHYTSGLRPSRPPMS
ncbi:MAG: universal stress protein [Deltaproteobacteria bacterium]|nr:universal stress protein [Deltaproteobacteria bacterium]